MLLLPNNTKLFINQLLINLNLFICFIFIEPFTPVILFQSATTLQTCRASANAFIHFHYLVSTSHFFLKFICLWIIKAYFTHLYSPFFAKLFRTHSLRQSWLYASSIFISFTSVRFYWSPRLPYLFSVLDFIFSCFLNPFLWWALPLLYFFI